MNYLLILISLLILPPCFSQNEPIIAYHHKAKDFEGILLLNCNVGYYYIGPHLFIDEIFSYEIKGDKMIRTFDTEYSLYQQVDTLIIGKKSLRAVNGLAFKKVSPRKRDKLIRKYIHPSADIGNFKIFLKRTSSCKGND